MIYKYLPYLLPSSSLKSSAFMDRRWSEHLAAEVKLLHADANTTATNRILPTDFIIFLLLLGCECRFWRRFTKQWMLLKMQYKVTTFCAFSKTWSIVLWTVQRLDEEWRVFWVRDHIWLIQRVTSDKKKNAMRLFGRQSIQESLIFKKKKIIIKKKKKNKDKSNILSAACSSRQSFRFSGWKNKFHNITNI